MRPLRGEDTTRWIYHMIPELHSSARQEHCALVVFYGRLVYL